MKPGSENSTKLEQKGQGSTVTFHKDTDTINIQDDERKYVFHRWICVYAQIRGLSKNGGYYERQDEKDAASHQYGVSRGNLVFFAPLYSNGRHDSGI